MITAVRIEKNKELFLEKSREYNVFTKELEDFLGEDFFLAPASAYLNMYGCYPGGLVHHLLKVCKYSIQLNDLLPETMRQDKTAIVKTVFLSQIGKTFMFVPNESEWHRTNQGKMYEYKDDESSVSMSIGERSAYYAMCCGVQLTETEYQAIIFANRGDSDKSGKWAYTPLAHILKLGFEMALLEEKNGKG
jgi:hypothetical protein